jgi:hypothetical protein
MPRLSDDEMISRIKSCSTGTVFTISEIFCDARLEVMNWIWSVMTFQQDCICIKLLDSTTHSVLYKLHIVIDYMLRYEQFLAFESVYQASISCGYDFPTEFIYSSTNIARDYWFNKFGPRGFVRNYIDAAIERADMEILDWYLNKIDIIPFKYSVICIRDKPIKVLNWIYDAYQKSLIPFVHDEFTISNYLLKMMDITTDMSNADCVNELMNILNWFYDRRDQLEFKYNENLFSDVISCDLILILQWSTVVNN